MLTPGSVVKAKVKSIATFGVFCEISDKDSAEPIKGLIHISEISDYFVKDVASYFIVGDVVQVEVLSYNPEKNQANLSYKALHLEEQKTSNSKLRETKSGFSNLEKSTKEKVENQKTDKGDHSDD